MHTAFYGKTKSGKTYAMQQLARSWTNQGGQVIVHDTKRQSWPTPHVFSEVSEFLAVARLSQNCLLIVDEGWKVFTARREDLENQWLANESRHQGHTFVMGSQRPNQVLPSVRSCFEHAFCFSLLFKDACEVCADFGFERHLAKRINALPQRTCIHLRHFQKPVEKIFSETQIKT